MSCVRQYLSENYNHLYRLARKYVGTELAGDLLNDLCLNYLNDNDHAEQLCARGELGAYLNRTMQICGFSSSSPFYKKYKKHSEKESRGFPLERLVQVEPGEEGNDIRLENQIEGVFHILREIRWIDAEIFKAYYLHEHSLNTLSDATGISRHTIYKAVKTAQAYCEENRERIRGYSREPDSGAGEEGSGSSSGGRLRMREKESVVEQEVPILQAAVGRGQETVGGRVATGEKAVAPEPSGAGAVHRPVPTHVQQEVQENELRSVRT